MKLYEVLKEAKHLPDIIITLKSLNKDIRAPRGLKKEYILIQHLITKAEWYDIVPEFITTLPKSEQDAELTEYKSSIVNEIMAHYKTFDKAVLDKLLSAMSNNQNKPLTVKTKYATYHKSDSSAYTKFEKAVADIDAFLKTLKGYHKKPLKDLVIRFVKSSSMKSIGKYKTDTDELWINLGKVGKTSEEYGSARYVVLHELGHRYLRYNRQSWNHDENKWITTRYSEVDSFNGEEKFAELFAMTHWKSKYKEYADLMTAFEKLIK